MSRFYVATVSGWPSPAPTRMPRGLTAMVLDRAYCHRVVWEQRTERQGGRRKVADALGEAEARCAELNAEDAQGELGE